MSDSQPAAPAQEPAKKSSMVKIIAIVLLVVLLGGGGAGFWMWKSGKFGGQAAAAPAKPEPVEATGVVSLEPFLCNLTDSGGHAYLRTTIKLLVKDPAEAKEFQESDFHKAKVRSILLETLSQQAATDLVTPEGKEKLKETLLKRIESLKLKIEVHDVLFADFVVQY
jgi:flagellar protein FliL